MTLKKISISGLLFLIMGSLLITSCSSVDDNDVNADTPVAIRLTSNVDVVSRTSLQDLQIENGQEVGLFIKKTSPSDEVLYSNEKIIANGNGAFTYSTPMFYPVSNENVDFYAYHPYGSSTLFDNIIFHTVATDQTSKESYLNSDFLYASSLDIAKTTNAVLLRFSHKLSKLNFTIKEGTGMDLSGLTSVEILDVSTIAAINMPGGEYSLAPGNAPTTIKVYGVHGTVGAETEISGMSAIIIPQTIPSSNKLFKITINGGTPDETSYYYTPTSLITYEVGKKYSYILTVNHAGITVTSSIEDWISGGDDIEGEGTLE